ETFPWCSIFSIIVQQQPQGAHDPLRRHFHHALSHPAKPIAQNTSSQHNLSRRNYPAARLQRTAVDPDVSDSMLSTGIHAPAYLNFKFPVENKFFIFVVYQLFEYPGHFSTI